MTVHEDKDRLSLYSLTAADSHRSQHGGLLVRESPPAAPPDEQLLFTRYRPTVTHVVHFMRGCFHSNHPVPAGSSRASCFRFEIDGTQVGWIPPHVAPLLTRYPEVFSPPHTGAVSLSPSLDSYGTRSEAVDAVLQTLRQEESLTCLKGWRDEVRPSA